MANRKKKPFVQAQVPEELRDEYYRKCESIYGMKRQSDKPIRKFVREFTAGRIYIVNGEFVIRPMK